MASSFDQLPLIYRMANSVRLHCPLSMQASCSLMRQHSEDRKQEIIVLLKNAGA